MEEGQEFKGKYKSLKYWRPFRPTLTPDEVIVSQEKTKLGSFVRWASIVVSVERDTKGQWTQR
jgi:hypothetical protein